VVLEITGSGLWCFGFVFVLGEWFSVFFLFFLFFFVLSVYVSSLSRA
jgi:hypothetical protein